MTPLSFKEKEKVPITTSKTTRDPALRRPRKYRPRRRETRWHGARSGPGRTGRCAVLSRGKPWHGGASLRPQRHTQMRGMAVNTPGVILQLDKWIPTSICQNKPQEVAVSLYRRAGGGLTGWRTCRDAAGGTTRGHTQPRARGALFPRRILESPGRAGDVMNGTKRF